MLIPEDYNDVHRAVLRALAVQVIATLDPQHSMEQLIKNPVTLHSYVSKMRVNWPSIARDIGMPRASVYHWYNETHLRRISGVKMTPEDKKVIKEAIIRGIETQRILEDGFQMSIRNLFEAKYPRQEIMMTYNNMLRSRDIQRILNRKKIVLPTRRHADSLIGKGKHIPTDQQQTFVTIGHEHNDLNSSVANSILCANVFPHSAFLQPAGAPIGFSPLPPSSFFGWQSRQPSIPPSTNANINDSIIGTNTTSSSSNESGSGSVVGTSTVTGGSVTATPGSATLPSSGLIPQPGQGPVLMCLLPTQGGSQAMFSLPLSGHAFIHQAPMFPQFNQELPIVYKT